MESELNDFSRENYLKNKKKNKKDFNVDFIDDEPNNNAETNDNNDANKNSVFGLSFEELVNQTTARFPQNKEEEINPEFENYDEDLRKENSKKSKLKEKKQNKKEDIKERKEKTDSEIYQKKISKSDKHKHDDNKLKEKKHKKKEKKEESEKKDPNAFSFEIDQEEEESENSKEENSVEEVKYHNYKKDTKKNFEDEDYLLDIVGGLLSLIPTKLNTIYTVGAILIKTQADMRNVCYKERLNEQITTKSIIENGSTYGSYKNIVINEE